MYKNQILCFVFILMLTLFGCNERLYSNLDEKEINEMLAILLRKGISSEKMQGEEGKWHLMVSKSEIARAIEILNDFGYPKVSYKAIGDIFKKEGLISSPLEERIRFIYALSQEVSETISTIDGVLAARVHIVLPENNPLSETLIPSSASVFIKYRPDSQIESSILKIKDLVVNSIEGLDYKKVSVALFPAKVETFNTLPLRFVRILGVNVAPESVSLFRWIVGILFVLTIGLAAGVSFLFHQSRHQPKSGRSTEAINKIKQIGS